MDTNKFVVANTTGNTTIAGTLGVSGATNLDALTTSDLAMLDSLIVSNNTTLEGGLEVTGATNLNGDVTIADGQVLYVNLSSRIKFL